MSYARMLFHARIHIRSLQRWMSVAVPQAIDRFVRPPHDQLHFNRPEAKLEVLSVIEGRLGNENVRTALTDEQWSHYNERIATALVDEDPGVCECALRLIVRHGRVLNLSRTAVYDLIGIYRGHPNDRLRRIAVVALAQLRDPWSMDFLQRCVRLEAEPRVRYTMKAVLSDYRRSSVDLGPPQSVTG